ncbi:MAG TPA: hypothetical protein VE196_02985 [Pseudonocardiaceae bacterium]|nr:hypothetical protein [Pseudonocardiaceae bacterium]
MDDTALNELGLVLYPLPRTGDYSDEVLGDVCDVVWYERREWLENWRISRAEENNGGRSAGDPLLEELVTAHRRLRSAEETIRLLVAYGRHFARPERYRLEPLARASGYSVSGVSTAYGAEEIAEVKRRIDAEASNDPHPTRRPE